MNEPMARLLRMSRAEREAALRRGPDASVLSGDHSPESGPGIRRTSAPASFGQEQLWVLDQLAPGLPRYNVPFTFEIDGLVDTGLLIDAVHDVAARHESLRTALGYEDGELRQQITPPARWQVDLADVSADPDPDAAARQQAIALTLRPFRLDRGPLWHATLIRKDPAGTRHVLVWVASHAIMDGWSIGLFLDELATAYNRRELREQAAWAPPSAQFTDFAAWQRRELASGRFDEMVGYWRRQLAGIRPLAFPAGAVPSETGATHRFPLDATLVSAVAETARKCHATPFMVFLAAYQILLAGQARSKDVCVGTIVSGRTRPEFERILGSCINTVVIRFRAGEDGADPSGTAVIGQVRDSVFEALDQQDLPFGKLVEALAPERQADANPLCRTVFTYGATPMTAAVARLGGATVRAVGVSNGTVRFDYELAVEPDGDGWIGRLEHDTGLLPPGTAAVFCAQYVAVVRRLSMTPAEPLSSYATVISPLAAEPPSAITEPAAAPAGQASEATIAALMPIWAELLEVPEIGPDDDFFVLGGHSMLAAQLVRQVRAELGAEIGLAEFFSNCTVSGMAIAVDAHRDVADPARAELLAQIESMSDEEVTVRLAELGDQPPG